MRLAMLIAFFFEKNLQKTGAFFRCFVYIGVRRGDPPPATKNVL